jgi:hypothetical protein
MYLNAEKVNLALEWSDTVLQALGAADPASKRIPISIEELQDFVVKTTGWTVVKEEVTYPQGQYIRGRIHRYANKVAKVHVSRHQDLDWKRLVAAKELFELLIGKPEDMSPYGDEILDVLVLEGHVGIISPENPNGDKAQTELLSEIAAMETLYPMAHRKIDLESMHPKGTLTVGKLSLKYGIPEGTASTLLNARYIAQIERARRLKL